jgi:site-specific DNA-methyltransferase (adenine-specific)
MKYPNDFINKVIQGDCVQVMGQIPDNSIDTLICDPPYGLAFMGKEWDSFGTDLQKYQEWTRQWATEALRVAKPGATLLCFGGTRTFHRLTCGLEDAGWQIKDVLMWLYGSGFPKSLDISKAIDKLKDAEREVVGKGKSGKTAIWQINGGMGDYNITAPATQEAKEWEGYGTALKPAYEPIIMAMKPNEGSYANNALKWGVAGLNINGCRIATNEQLGRQASSTTLFGQGKMTSADFINNSNEAGGRFPSNVILDEESAELLDKQSGISKSVKSKRGIQRKGYSAGVEWERSTEETNTVRGHNDKGGASRFFYCAKASRSERDIGCEDLELKQTTDGCIRSNPETASKYQANSTFRRNIHPTVKPLKLMVYLCNLTKTPTGGIVLDPFGGSGTTAMACKITGRDFILIEKEPEYIDIAIRRIEAI